MKFDFFKKLFCRKEDKPITEEEIIEDMVSNEEVVLETVDEPEVDGGGFSGPIPVSYDNVNFVVLLDNGHARSTAGKRSPKLDDGRVFYEWEFNRDIVRRVAAGLDKLGIKYHILVPEDEKDITLTERAGRANNYCKKYGTKNCMFISVHSNAFGKGDKWESPAKWSVWTTVGVTKSDEYGRIMYETAEEMLAPYGFGCRNGKVQGNGNDGPDYEENFTVLYKTWCPAILTENLFYTNKKECEWLMTDTGRQVIADIHIEGIRRIIEKL